MPAIESGATCFFHQNNAPTGWTKLTDIDDHGIRVTTTWVSGSQGNTSSPVLQPFTAVFSSTAPFDYTTSPNFGTSSSTTLADASTPPHVHKGPANGNITTTAGAPTNANLRAASPPATAIVMATPSFSTQSVAPTGGGGHTHPTTMTTASLTGSLNFNIKYVDVIRATRN